MNKPMVKHPIAASFIAVFVFLASMFAGSMLLVFAPPVLSNSGEFVAQFVCESVVCLAGIALVAVFGYSKIWSRTENFGKGLISSTYIIVVSCLAAFEGLILRLSEGISEDMEIIEFPETEPLWKIAVFLLMGFLVGVAEESFFRGVVANLFWDKHAKDPAGVWTATIYTGLMFGLMHCINLFSSDPVGVIVQIIAAIAMGMAFTAIYYRCKNIWVVIFIHAFLDICALLPEGLFGGSLTEEISSYQPVMAITSSLPYIIVTCVLLRKKKLVEMLAGEGGYGSIPNPNGYIQTPDGPMMVQYEIRSSQKSRASLIRVAVITTALAITLFMGAMSLSGELQRIIDQANGEATLDYLHSGEWNGERTFGQETLFEVSYSYDYNVEIKTLPSEYNAYVLIQIKQGDEIVYQENFGGRNDVELELYLDKGEYSLVLVYNFSEVTNPKAEYYTEVVIE